jgi:hypothetical protein
MTAIQALAKLKSEGVNVAIDGAGLRVDAPPEWWDRVVDGQFVNVQFVRAYKTEILWRLRHPEGDPDASGYQVKVIAGGEESRVALDVLIAEGKEIARAEDLRPKTPGMDLNLWAAAVALAKREGRPYKWN